MIKYMDIKEFVELGYLQEANRKFFHPLGLALEATKGEDGNWFLSGVWDYREDPEGNLFDWSCLSDAERKQISARRDYIAAEEAKRDIPRLRKFGFIVQPVEESDG